MSWPNGVIFSALYSSSPGWWLIEAAKIFSAEQERRFRKKNKHAKFIVQDYEELVKLRAVL